MKIIETQKIKNKGTRSKGIKIKALKTKAFSFVLKSFKSSLTLEAAVALPIFIFFVIAITYFLIIVSLQTNIQVGMDEAARSIGKKIYLANNIETIYEDFKGEDNTKTRERNILDDAEKTKEGENLKIDDETKSLVEMGINPLTIKTWILKGKLFDRVAESKITGGVVGFRTDKATYDEKEGILDIVVNYTYQIPFLPASIANLDFVQRSKTHVWTGRQIKLGIDGAGSEKQTVYITPTGTVYHTSKSCPYLDLSIHMISYSEIEAIRNKSEGKYYRCSECAKGKTPGMVYITDYGTKWHTSLNCSGLKRTIIEKDISEIGDMHQCSKCSASKKGSTD